MFLYFINVIALGSGLHLELGNPRTLSVHRSNFPHPHVLRARGYHLIRNLLNRAFVEETMLQNNPTDDVPVCFTVCWFTCICFVICKVQKRKKAQQREYYDDDEEEAEPLMAINHYTDDDDDAQPIKIHEDYVTPSAPLMPFAAPSQNMSSNISFFNRFS
ncbi:hypothetical protein LOD99_3645 [Oopsacas minuta]|uniref:Uncharacterized protein n=1 Tax=Oopsacas minuta TaxID=111878 RepID=A0AAV7JZI1_9METZ|nr:hypothetical protein LOD99_3645 [Oopsacas minuta]